MMQRSKVSSFFKTKQPKIALYRDLDRKLRESSLGTGFTYVTMVDSGNNRRQSTTGAKIKIQFNDEVMNADDLALTNKKSGAQFGSVKKGKVILNKSPDD